MQLYVKCPLVTEAGQYCNGVIALEVDQSVTVGEVKSMIHERGGLSPEKQQLSFVGETLEDDRKLSSYKICDNCLLEETSEWIAVRIRSEMILLPVDLNKETVSDIKARIQENEKIPKSQQIKLYFRNYCSNQLVHLQEYKTLKDSGVSNGDQLYLRVPAPHGSVELYVRTINGKTITLNIIELSNTVEDIKTLIIEKEGLTVLPHELKLFYADRQLENYRTLSSYNIQQQSTLHLCNILIIKTLTNIITSLEVEPTDTIERIKIIIKNKADIPVHQQRLVFAEKQLEDDKTLSDCKIPFGAIVRFVLRLDDGTLHVKIHNGKTIINLEAKASDTIAHIKAQILGIPPNQQQLTYDGKILEDCRTLADYGIQNESKLLLMGTITLHVTTSEDYSFTITVSVKSKGFNVKQLIIDDHSKNIPANHQIVLYTSEHTEIKDKHTLEECKIQDGDPVCLVSVPVQPYKIYSITDTRVDTHDVYSASRALKGREKLIFSGKKLELYFLNDVQEGALMHVVRSEGFTTIHISTNDQRKLISFNVDCFAETALSLKARIWAEVPEMPPPSQQRLTYKSTHLEDSQILYECGLTNADCVMVSVLQKIYIRCPDGSMTDINTHVIDKVLTVKRLIWRKTAIEPNKQQLYYDGRVMDDECTVESYILTTNPMLQLCKSQCTYDPLQEKVSSEGKQIHWKQYGVEVTVPPGVIQEGTLILRVYDIHSATCFEYHPVYIPYSSVYELSLSSSEQIPPGSVQVTLTKFRLRSRPCMIAASRDPSKWTPDQLTPIFSFYEVERLERELRTGRVELALEASGVFLLVAGFRRMSEETRTIIKKARPTVCLVKPVTEYSQSLQKPQPLPRHSVPPPRPQAPPDSSPEHCTMVRCTPQLTDTLSIDPQRISDSLFSTSAIPQTLHDLINENTLTRREKASRLVAAMTDRVSASPSDFTKFVAILREQGSWTANIVSLMEATLTETRFDSPCQ